MRRVFHHHDKWEDHQNGMYNLTCDNIPEMVEGCRKLLANPYALYTFMKACASFWPYAAEHNLSCIGRNRQAWLGQAACCYHLGAPEHITKMAWWQLTDDERRAANEVADKVIEEWEIKYVGHGKQTSLFD